MDVNADVVSADVVREVAWHKMKFATIGLKRAQNQFLLINVYVLA